MIYGFIKPISSCKELQEFGLRCQHAGVKHVEIAPIFYDNKTISTAYLSTASQRYFNEYFIACDLKIHLNAEQYTVLKIVYGDNLTEHHKIIGYSESSGDGFFF